MQCRAIFEAAADVQKRHQGAPGDHDPLVGFKKELDLQVEIVHRVAAEVSAQKKTKINYLIGTMIEVPRGALTSHEIRRRRSFSRSDERSDADDAGMSRDDSGSFLPKYQELEIVKKNPSRASTDGRRRLMQIAVEAGANAPDIKLGICGEHAATRTR